MKRHTDAVNAQAGASNPIALTNSLLAAMRECSIAGTKAICSDPAVRLIAHQIAYLLNIRALDVYPSQHSDAMATCETADAVQS